MPEFHGFYGRTWLGSWDSVSIAETGDTDLTQSASDG